MRYQELVESVRDRAGMDSTEQARDSLSAVLSTLGHCLPPEQRSRLAERLPGSLEPAADVPGPPEIRDGSGLVVEIGQRLDVPPERARYLAQAVVGSLREGDPELIAGLREHLSSDILDVLLPAGDSPERSESARSEVPTELSDDEIAQSLRRLPSWTGDRTAISRTVSLPTDRHEPLINRVQREARDFNDHAHIQRQGDEVTFTLNTGRPPAVTRPDIELAERIDHAVAEVGSGG